MNQLKKLLGLVWMALGPAAIIFLAGQAYEKTSLAAEGSERTNTALQWGIILFIFIPICAGLVIFGYYAVKGAYDRLPADSGEAS
ncbi:hypothetical protein C7T94_03385 [Pedobacter yulinensis]|uniref:Uncharacterized protein n=1 Tax=Pedobacter yulinensis TaxID=2126353 RepID=A0A2T3HRY3_9SPHI|nr:hypothetical protein [Pedobacter yulinensis]PST85161.1 hypothetical protein C7T94_03385 [Pedobacter yulinensis]